MHSPIKNQQYTSTATKVLSQASRTVKFLYEPVLALAISLEIPDRIAGISLGEGGTNSTMAYL